MKWATLAAVFCLTTVDTAQAWSLRTHLWIGEQVLSEVISNCKVTFKLTDAASTIDAEVPADVCAALRSDPAAYRAGHLGPDLFPDLISGQMTTHPGIEGGWQSEKWLRQIVEAAGTNAEISFAYGFLGHASGDIFAHTYINQYAGDIFTLSNDGNEAELRHFSLEKYIESKTPKLPYDIDVNSVLAPSRYVSRQLIYDNSLIKQYQKQASTAHLASLNLARQAIMRVTSISKDITDKIVDSYAEYYKLQVREIEKIATGERQVQAARIALRGAKEAFNARNDILRFEEKRLKEFEEFLDKYDEELSIINSSMSVSLDAIAEAARIYGQISSKFNELRHDVDNAVNSVENALCGKTKDVCKNVTRNVCKWFGLDKVCDAVEDSVCTTVSIADASCTLLQPALANARQVLADAEAEFNKWVAKEVEEKARYAAQAVKKAELFATKAGIDLSIGALRQKIELEKSLTDEARKSVEFADKKLVDLEIELVKLREAARPVLDLIDKIAGVAKEYNSLELFIKSWRDGVDRAGDDFIDASLSAGFSIVNVQGSPLDHYRKWLECSALNYLGVPWQIPRTYCAARDIAEDIVAQIEAIKEMLPPVLRWLIFPLDELKKEVLKVAKKEAWRAAQDTSDFVLGAPTGRFIGMLGNQEQATGGALRDIFGRSSRKHLLSFSDVVPLVDRDIGLQDDVLSPETFHALRNSVVLAKLSLLGAEQLNKLHADLSGNAPTRYGLDLYGDQIGKRFSLLFNAVRSLDGNHSWQPFGLPYLRTDKSHGPIAEQRRYGFSVHDNRQDGFRLFQDPIARERVFLRLFSGPVEAGMATLPEAQYPNYRFPACQANPFPRTVDDAGRLMPEDGACVDRPPVVGRIAPPGMAASAAGLKLKIAGPSPRRSVTVAVCQPQRFRSISIRIVARVSSFSGRSRYASCHINVARRPGVFTGSWEISRRGPIVATASSRPKKATGLSRFQKGGQTRPRRFLLGQSRRA